MTVPWPSRPDCQSKQSIHADRRFDDESAGSRSDGQGIQRPCSKSQDMGEHSRRHAQQRESRRHSNVHPLEDDCEMHFGAHSDAFQGDPDGLVLEPMNVCVQPFP